MNPRALNNVSLTPLHRGTLNAMPASIRKMPAASNSPIEIVMGRSSPVRNQNAGEPAHIGVAANSPNYVVLITERDAVIGRDAFLLRRLVL